MSCVQLKSGSEISLKFYAVMGVEMTMIGAI
jgi:hypothetical protein